MNGTGSERDSRGGGGGTGTGGGAAASTEAVDAPALGRSLAHIGTATRPLSDTRQVGVRQFMPPYRIGPRAHLPLTAVGMQLVAVQPSKPDSRLLNGSLRPSGLSFAHGNDADW
eukprot:CAMPEP_0182593650 /NCGR_PEP_ID=MMETSP1324-20130603/78494_1 /TAXON_ID=236786 /ORGANISM="Florenciella sp., Strain RCC1587" /LENGTH=113 /DNA_ID=CAMNT_0024811131 /DNA_START=203 /DNA_END=543 /DNA_ORIENTATION=+